MSQCATLTTQHADTSSLSLPSADVDGRAPSWNLIIEVHIGQKSLNTWHIDDIRSSIRYHRGIDEDIEHMKYLYRKLLNLLGTWVSGCMVAVSVPVDVVEMTFSFQTSCSSFVDADLSNEKTRASATIDFHCNRRWLYFSYFYIITQSETSNNITNIGNI